MKASEIITKYATPVVGVGVSGGIDSVCLLVLAVKTLGSKRVKCVHIEHGIRGEESVQDMAFVQDLCAKLGVECFVKKADIPSLARMNGNSIETQARLYRKSVFEQFSREFNGAKVLLAHHKDDQIETVLMHFFRGCSLKGLIGMSECDGIYVRPFINLTRLQIQEFACANSLEYRTDSTNEDCDYTRNLVRNEIIPSINKKFNVEAILRLSQNAQIAYDFISSFVNDDYFKVETNGVTFPCIKAHKAVINEYVSRAFVKAGLVCDVESKHINAVASLMHSENGSMVSLVHSFVAIKEYDKIAVYKQLEKSDESVDFALGLTPFYNGYINVCECEKVEKGKTVFDANKVPYSAVIRFRQDGDVFKPYNGGTKKLKEYFIDKKVPRRKRDFIPLLCDGNVVLAVIGMQVSDLIKVDEKTTMAYEIGYEE